MHAFTPALAALLCTLTAAAQAAPNDGIVGTYARVEVGRSHLGLSDTTPRTGQDDHGQAAKIFGGYRFEAGHGFELGYAALGTLSETVAVGSGSVRHDGRGSSLFAAATGRHAVGASFALHGRLGVSSGRVSGSDARPQAEQLTGRRTSPLVGLGLEYRPRSNVALTLDYDSYGRLSDKVRASALLFGLHFTL